MENKIKISTQCNAQLLQSSIPKSLLVHILHPMAIKINVTAQMLHLYWRILLILFIFFCGVCIVCSFVCKRFNYSHNILAIVSYLSKTKQKKSRILRKFLHIQKNQGADTTFFLTLVWTKEMTQTKHCNQCYLNTK